MDCERRHKDVPRAAFSHLRLRCHHVFEHCSAQWFVLDADQYDRSGTFDYLGIAYLETNQFSKDEYANHIDAGGFTMPLISETLSYANSFRKQFGLEQNETWTEISENVLLIREDGVTLEYTTMNGTAVVKQADIVLVTYPLVYDNNYTAQHALNDLDYVSPSCLSFNA